ncbi:unnamed protein product [Rotaria magnacalcarata]|uniref:Carboxylesterase type B domain-containing protein n=2 Tax=Rotaria magnacalcarata TaxID=392030 RepID=A0A816PFR9_9BILA|nr:unnamed protein product [Rotaria magnacalcarata]CAF1626544.1 unnamed protein product [Rotaria magnacalcarata]CAF2047518.1 unnamed protein product [Rotaria magnacalcarata]CAF3817981.1 unnamed protein product [Rotaria magnacalcarata]CAF3896503.1 unnamed protein product [Rotaria magnacalcarata]
MSWNIFVFFLAIIILFLSSIFDSTLAVQLLNTSSGIYVGQTVNYENAIVQRYLGIQYGNVNKRFDRATLIERENDQIMNATKFGPSCKPTEGSCGTTAVFDRSTSQCSLSYGIFSVKSSLAEQCLFLNVYMPVSSNNKRKKKAIFIWIHGGSGQIGTGNIFDGTILAAVGDIIVITFNFRLNLFGFLSSGDQRLEGNLGLYDQALVLDWIYKNGNALGGDVKRITVGGHSAGAPHSYYLAKSPLNKGRIHRLILQSGSPFNIWSHLKAREAMEKFDIVAHDNGCASTMTFDEKLTCLQDRDFDLIAEHEHHSYTSANHTNVVVTGNFMSEFREVFELNDTLANIDILMGSTDDEGVYVAVVPILMEQHDQEIVALSHINFTEIALKFLAAMQPNKTCLHHQALELYHINNIPINCSQSSDCYCSVFYNYSRLISDILFNNDYYRFIEERIKHSNRTYIYQYSHRTAQEHPSTCNEYLHEHNLVGHFAELEYTWGVPLLFDMNNFNHNITPLIKYVRYTSSSVVDINISNFYSDEQIQFSKQLIEQWSNFIKYGQPKSSIIKGEWRSVSNMSTASIMHLKVNESKIRNLTLPSGIQFWRNQCSSKLENSTKIIQKNSVSSIHKISLIIFISSLLSHGVGNLIDGFN